MPEYIKPTLRKLPENAPFLEGSLAGKLRLQRATSTGAFRFPPAPVDPTDLSEEFEWADVSGRARLWSWTVFHQVYFPSFKDDVPYPVIFVQLEEGPFMAATLPADVSVDDLRIDMPLQVEFQPATDEFALAVFRPLEV
jgi:uncharacterized OB-fold protein